MTRNHSTLDVPGRTISLEIDKSYVPLELRSGGTIDAGEILHKTGGVVLVGDPGAGKSALFSFFIRTLSTRLQQSPGTVRLPIYLPLYSVSKYLADYKSKKSPSEAYRFLNEWFIEAHIEPLEMMIQGEPLDVAASQRGVVVFLDGLDELGSEVIDEAAQFAADLMRYLNSASGENLVVISTRSQAIDLAPSLFTGEAGGFSTVELRPFSQAAIFAFLRRWPYGAGIDPVKQAQKLFRNLRLSPTLSETCTNPLALALYVDKQQRFDEFGSEINTMSETRSAFFQDIVDHLLVRRRIQTQVHQVPNVTFRKLRTDFFRSIATEHVRNRESLNRISDEILLDKAEMLVGSERISPAESIVRIATDTGLIRQNPDGTWRFIHASFLAFFFAIELSTHGSSNQRKQLINKLRNDPTRYEEAFYFAVGLMAKQNSPHLSKLLSEVGRNANVGRLYPRAALESQAYLEDDFADRIRASCRRWKRDSEDDVLFRDLLMVLTDYERSCQDLGFAPQVSVAGSLLNDVGAQGAEGELVRRIARSNVDLGAKLGAGLSFETLLTSGSAEESVLALYDAVVLEAAMELPDPTPRLTAVVAESALRSSLTADFLTEHYKPTLPTMRPLGRGSGWAESWRIRDTEYGRYVADATSYIRSQPTAEAAADFPHLSLLLAAKPARRLQAEIWLGSWRLSLALAAPSVLLGLVAFVLLESPVVGLAVASALAGISSIVMRRLALRDRALLSTSQALNLTPVGNDVVFRLGEDVVHVDGDLETLSKIRWRRPRLTDGPVGAIYTKSVPFLWVRFSPLLGDQRISRSGCATVQQFRTETIRSLWRQK